MNVISTLGTLFLTMMLIAGSSESMAWPMSQAVPGGIITLKLDTQLETAPSVSFLKRPVAVVHHDNAWHAVIGLPLSMKQGLHTATVNNKPISFHVTAKDYPEQRITLKTKKHVNLSPEDLARHRGEKVKAKKAFKTFNTQLSPDLAMIKPVEGPYSSPFGLKRFFNDQPRNPHSGLDIAAPTGTPIKAPSAGKVVLTGNFFFNGNVVYLDHGQGMVSMFCHLSEIDVKAGDTLSKGDILGKVGATGRVTGPHLHWSLSLNNTRVDPILLLPEIEQSKI
jgi:murein DD-endopeptidase MepM/ murein hydrolase activator NlpD